MYMSPLLWLCLASSLMPALSKVIWTDGDENGNATLVCPEGEKTQWITPSQLILHPEIVYDENKYMMDKDNTSLLTVMKLNATDAGVYLCGIPTDSKSDQDSVIKIELHVKLPYHDTDYTDNAVTGVVVACIIAFIFGGSCLLYKYRYKEKSFTDMEVVIDTGIKQRMKESEALPSKQEMMENRSLGEGCENPAMDHSDSESDDDKKEKVPMEATSHQDQSTSKDTQETGM